MRGARRLFSQQWIDIAVGDLTTSYYQRRRVVRVALSVALASCALQVCERESAGPVTRTELVRAGDECCLLATPSFVGGLCTGCAVSGFQPALSGAQRRRSGLSQALNPRICPSCSRA